MDNSENNARHRLIRTYQMLMKETDAQHPLIITNILPKLQEEYGIEATRDVVRDDLKAMCDCGLPVEKRLARQYQFYYDGHVFETAELKLLIDAVASSKFITERESHDLIQKILSTTSRQEAESLKRHIYVDARPKTDNESGYYIVDAVNEAIETGRKISFQYTDYDSDKNRILRHDGRLYIVSPYALLWDGDYYYTIGWLDPPGKITPLPDADAAPKRRRGRPKKKAADTLLPTEPPVITETADLPSEGSLRTFRLDRIAAQPTILNEPAVPAPEGFDVAAFRRSVFRMYSTDEPVDVTLLCENRIMRAIIDNFGTDTATHPVDENHFRATVTVCPSPTFYRWVFGWGWDGSIMVEGPEEVIRQYRRMLGKALRRQPRPSEHPN